MKNTLLRWLFRRYQSDFLDLIAEDFYKDIPESVSEPAIQILRDKASKMKRWFLYQAFWIQRRIEKDKSSSDKVIGMLVCFRLINHMIDRQTVVAERKTEKQRTKEEQEQRQTLEDALLGVQTFVKGTSKQE